MSDDSFIREVNEELRQDRAKELARTYGVWFAALALLLVLATAGWRGYEYWMARRAGSAGDAFSQALFLATSGKTDEAMSALKAVEQTGHGAYPVLSRMSEAGLLAEKGDTAAAVAAFDKVTADNAAPASIRDVARLRAGLLLVDYGSYADVSSRVEALTDDTNPLRFSAREALGLAAWKAGKSADALKLFESIAGDPAASANARQRATVMSGLIRSAGEGK